MHCVKQELIFEEKRGRKVVFCVVFFQTVPTEVKTMRLRERGFFAINPPESIFHIIFQKQKKLDPFLTASEADVRKFFL